jgi:hypothetical protein
MDITHMSHSMREQERISFFATDCDGFFVGRERRIAPVQVTLYLAQTLERPDQLKLCAGLATKRYRRDIIAMSVGRSILKSRAIRFCH